jgi:hypothetical protein
MRKIATAILSCSSILIVPGIICARIALALHQSADSRVGGAPAAPGPKKKRIVFTRTEMGELKADDGTRLSFTGFEASDGVKLTAVYGEFDSPTRANEEFDKELHKAIKVVERGEKKDGTGRVVGVRAQAVFPSAGSPKLVQAVL